MSEQTIDPIDGIQLVRSYLLHCRQVRAGLRKVVRELDERAEIHDTSKLESDEFAGFTRINKAARENPYLSPEYRAGLAQEQPVIDLHYSRNSHHPEFHGSEIEGSVSLGVRVAAEDMGFLDIIEMVCDWRGAYLAYGSKGTWEENIVRQRDRYKVDQWFTESQWWLIQSVAEFLVNAEARR